MGWNSLLGKTFKTWLYVLTDEGLGTAQMKNRPHTSANFKYDFKCICDVNDVIFSNSFVHVYLYSLVFVDLIKHIDTVILVCIWLISNDCGLKTQVNVQKA